MHPVWPGTPTARSGHTHTLLLWHVHMCSPFVESIQECTLSTYFGACTYVLAHYHHTKGMLLLLYFPYRTCYASVVIMYSVSRLPPFPYTSRNKRSLHIYMYPLTCLLYTPSILVFLYLLLTVCVHVMQGFVVGFMASKIFCLHLSNMKTIDVPQVRCHSIYTLYVVYVE